MTNCRCRFTRWSAAVALAALGVLISCKPHDASGPGATQRDSAGVTIVENAGPAWSPNQIWSVDSSPTIIVGDSASRWEIAFVGRVQVLADSGVAITEGPDPAAGSRRFVIVVYDKTGRYRSTIGREGGGPGEFKASPMFAESGHGAFVAWDNVLDRLTWFSVDGKVVAERSLAGPNGLTALGVDANSVSFGIRADGSLLLAGMLWIPKGEGLQDRLIWPYVVRDSGTAAAALGAVPTSGTLISSRGTNTNPFDVRRRPVLGSDPFPVSMVGRGRWEVVQYGADGKLARIIRAPIPRLAVPPALAAKHQDAFRAPDSLPAALDLWDDRAGHLWVVRTPAAPDTAELADRIPTIFDVVAADGRWLGTVAIPLGIGDIVDVGGDYLAVVRRDADDLPTVRLHRINRW